MDLNDIYGIDNMAANLVNESQKECVVCYEANKDTVVLPCRHMCLCINCSQIVRMQTNKCPICRTTVSSFLHIKYDVDANKLKPQPIVVGENKGNQDNLLSPKQKNKNIE